TLICFYFIIGFYSTQIYLKSNSIWDSYFYRVGIIAFSQIISSSLIYKGTPYFITSNYLFMLEGIIFLIINFILIQLVNKKQKLLFS
ncbi:MAG: hypothetical protein O3A55_05535, partial [Bacteroidetes bacterium]|nr:hypothetical protein [Bacteroidota bacterium]